MIDTTRNLSISADISGKRNLQIHAVLSTEDGTDDGRLELRIMATSDTTAALLELDANATDQLREFLGMRP